MNLFKTFTGNRGSWSVISPHSGNKHEARAFLKNHSQTACRFWKLQKKLFMKISSVIIILALGFQLLVASDGNSQNIAKVSLSLELKNESMKAAFKKIEKLTDFRFAYNEAQISHYRVSIEMDTRSLEETLALILEDSPLEYTIVNNKIIIHQEDEELSTMEGLSLKLLNTDQSIKVSGKVTDAEGKPLPNATIMIKGTLKGITTDLEGNYRITVPGSETILIFSYVGFANKEIKVGEQTTINITLEQSATELEEVTINAGYYNVKKREATGSISQISAKEIEQQPVGNPIATLQGRTPGVYIQQSTGTPGSGFTIKIRGRNSIASGNEPFYIIDGVPFTSTSLSSSRVSSTIIYNASPLNSINPADIESIEVLKDADATAIYGSRGANGVVLITTKKGKAGKMKVDINHYFGFGKVSNTLDLLNTEQYLEMRREAFKNDGVEPNESNAFDLLLWDTTRYTDWQKELIGGTAEIINTQASISGGSENTQFSVGLGYYNETTVFPGDFNDRRISTRFSINHVSPNQKFRILFSGSYSVNNNNLYSYDITGTAVILPPHYPDLLDENDNLLFHFGSNPYADLRRKYKANTDNFIGNTVLSYELLSGLQLKTSLGYTKMQRDEIKTTPQSTIRPTSSSKASSAFANNSIKTWIVEPQLNWKKRIGKGDLDILAGMTLQESIQEGQTIQATDFPSDALIENSAAAGSVRIREDNFIQYRYQAVFGRINYNWDRKYIVNLTARRDGSSRFGTGNRFSTFGAIGAAWIFSEEALFKKSSFLSFGKLRGSYGTTGNDQIGNYRYLETWRTVDYPYDGTSGLQPTRIGNPDYAWEVNRKLEASLELGFLKDRIFFKASYYHNRSSNQLVSFSLPLSSGFTSVQDNLDAVVQNTGLELELNTKNIQTSNLLWTTSFNITIPRNKLIAFPNLETSSYGSSYEIGKPLSIVNTYRYIGVDPETGVYAFEDVDGNGKDRDRPADQQKLEKVDQEFYGGLQNNISYKGFELDFLFQFVKQTGWNYIGRLLPPGMRGVNQPTAVLDRWQKPGDIKDVQRFTQGINQAFFAHLSGGDNRISDASFIRLKNVSLSYQFPEKITKRLKLQAMRMYLQGQNLLTITNYLGMDPENQNLRMLPPLRTISFGIQLTL